MTFDQKKLDEFLAKFVLDFGAVMHAATIVVGDKLGLYKGLAEQPLTPEDLARKTETDPRYVLEWLSAQAASGYVNYDASSGMFSLSEEQKLTLAEEGGPSFLPGAFDVAVAQFKAIPDMVSAFRTGAGYGWHQHDQHLFHGTERFFRPGYAANLISKWIPALDGMHEKLTAGASVADVGCGYGTSTIIMAQAYPQSNFMGVDYHEPSIQHANESAERAGVSDRVRFIVAEASAFPGDKYDLVTMFDCLHDMGDPIRVARHVRKTLGPEGTWMLVEPSANDRLEDNLNPVGRIFYSASTFICTPASRAQTGAMCLGAQAGEARTRDVVTRGGFRNFRRATETPFNLVYEARP